MKWNKRTVFYLKLKSGNCRLFFPCFINVEQHWMHAGQRWEQLLYLHRQWWGDAEQVWRQLRWWCNDGMSYRCAEERTEEDLCAASGSNSALTVTSVINNIYWNIANTYHANVFWILFDSTEANIVLLTPLHLFDSYILVSLEIVMLYCSTGWKVRAVFSSLNHQKGRKLERSYGEATELRMAAYFFSYCHYSIF